MKKQYLEIEHEGDFINYLDTLKEEEKIIAIQTLSILALLPAYKKLRKWVWKME